MTNLEAMQNAKTFRENSGILVCWTEIKKAAKKENHGLITKAGNTYDIFGRNVAMMKFRKGGRVWENN